MNPTPKVCILGATLNTGNRGVMALAASLVKLVLEVAPGAQVSFLISNENNQPFRIRVNGVFREFPVVNYRMAPGAAIQQHLLWILIVALLYRCLPQRNVRAALRAKVPWVEAVSQADLVGEIRGGDSFSDIYGLKRFLIGSLPVLVSLLIRPKITLLPQTYGPFRSKIAKAVARYVLHRADPIMTRDEESLGTIRALAPAARNIVVCPDVALALEAVPGFPVVTDPLLGETPREHLIGLNVNGLMYYGGYTRDNMFGLKLEYPSFLTQLAKALLANDQKHLLLVPHTFAQPGRVESDLAASRALCEALPAALRVRVHLLNGEPDQSELKGVIGRCGFFVGSRMHACIAALSQSIPSVGVAYSKKFAGVFQSLGVADCVIDGRQYGTADAVHLCLGLYSRRDELRSVLSRTVPEGHGLLLKRFREIVSARA